MDYFDVSFNKGAYSSKMVCLHRPIQHFLLSLFILCYYTIYFAQIELHDHQSENRVWLTR